MTRGDDEIVSLSNTLVRGDTRHELNYLHEQAEFGENKIVNSVAGVKRDRVLIEMSQTA